MQSLRFLMVSVVGVALDIALGWALATRLDLPLWLAGALGFATAALLNYLLHERWTFWGGRNRRSLGRFGRYLMSLGLTAVVRLLADRLMVMKSGRVVESGLTDQVLDDPQHAYTQLLVSSVLQV